MFESKTFNENDILENLSDVQMKRLSVTSLFNLIEKLKNEENDDLEIKINKIIGCLLDIAGGDTDLYKNHRRLSASVIKDVKKLYGLHKKGSLRSQYAAIGMIIGIAFGAVITRDVSSYVGLGFVFGLALGAGVGIRKEEILERKGKIY